MTHPHPTTSSCRRAKLSISAQKRSESPRRRTRGAGGRTGKWTRVPCAIPGLPARARAFGAFFCAGGAHCAQPRAYPTTGPRCTPRMGSRVHGSTPRHRGGLPCSAENLPLPRLRGRTKRGAACSAGRRMGCRKLTPRGSNVFLTGDMRPRKGDLR